MNHSMDKMYLGDRVELVMRPDKAKFNGVLSKVDDIAVYVNGLGFPHEDIEDIYPG